MIKVMIINHVFPVACSFSITKGKENNPFWGLSADELLFTGSSSGDEVMKKPMMPLEPHREGCQ